MKGICVHPNEKRITWQDIEPPVIQRPSDVLVETLEGGVCGTDREIAHFLGGEVPEGSDFLVLGHESLGRVVETGKAVQDLNPGDLVVPLVRRPCPHDHCAACRSNRQDFCFTGDFTERGIVKAHGFFASAYVDEEQYLVKVDPAIRDIAILAEPLTIAEKALRQIVQVQQRLPWACTSKGPVAGCCRAVVLGAGPIGFLGAMALKRSAFETILYSRDPVDSPKAKLARSFGVEYVCSEDVTPSELAESHGPIDVVYEATGAASISFQLLEALGVNGVFVFTGIPGKKEPIEIEAPSIMRNLVLRNQVVFGTVNADTSDFHAALHDLAYFKEHWPEAVAGLITDRHPAEAFEPLLSWDVGGIKHVLTFNP